MRATSENTKVEYPASSYPMNNRVEAGPDQGQWMAPPAYQQAPPPVPDHTGVYASTIRIVPRFHSYRNFRIFKYLGSSIGLSIVVFIFSMILTGGRITFYVGPAAFGVATIFHFCVLYKLKRESHQLEVETRHVGDVYTSPGSNVAGVVVNNPNYAPRATTAIVAPSVTTKIPTILAAWLVALLYWACVGLITWRVVEVYQTYGGYYSSSSSRNRDSIWTRVSWIKYIVEGALTLVEASTVTLIAFLCTKERGTVKRNY
jgi:hypothetical protein